MNDGGGSWRGGEWTAPGATTGRQGALGSSVDLGQSTLGMPRYRQATWPSEWARPGCRICSWAERGRDSHDDPGRGWSPGGGPICLFTPSHQSRAPLCLDDHLRGICLPQSFLWVHSPFHPSQLQERPRGVHALIPRPHDSARCSGKMWQSQGPGGRALGCPAALTVTVGVLDTGHVTTDKDEAEMGEGEVTQPQPRTEPPGSRQPQAGPPGVFSRAQPSPGLSAAGEVRTLAAVLGHL